MKQVLAIHGGTPVRTKPFPSKIPGASLIGAEELDELKDVVAEQSPFRHYGIGTPHKVADFEAEFRDAIGCRFALAVSSGSAALFCATVALGLGPGDEVILPAFGWFSDFYAIAHVGAVPVFADIDATLNLDPDDLERKITPRTRAVVVIHYQGGPADMDRILAIAQRHGLSVIEDCAQALGAEYKGRKLGTLGDVGIASFHSNKMITCGEGGMLYTNDEKIFARAVRYHDLGFIRPVFQSQLQDPTLADPANAFLGMQFRMSELAGAFMRAQLRKLPGLLSTCRTHHARIRAAFRDSRHFTFRPVDEGDAGITLFMAFPTQPQAARFQECLAAEGVSIGPSSGCSNILETEPIRSHRQFHEAIPPFGTGYAGAEVVYDPATMCTETKRILDRQVAIGIGPLYTEQDVDDIISAIAKVSAALDEEADA